MWTAANMCQLLLGIMTLQTATQELEGARSHLSTLCSVGKGEGCRRPPDNYGEEEEEEEEEERLQWEEANNRVKALRIKRFRGWLLVLKSLADLMSSTSQTGIQIHKRFPKAIGSWMHDGTIGLSGVLSSLIACFWKFPAAVSKGKSEFQDQQLVRNTAAAIFAFMQMSALLKNRPRPASSKA
jgi:hypothetical protein